MQQLSPQDIHNMTQKTCIQAHRFSSAFQNRRSGTVAVLFLFIIPVLILLVGFSVDYAHMLRSHSELRAVADLSAKAAADTLSSSQSTSDAIAAAQNIAQANIVAGEPYTLDASNIIFGRSVKEVDGTWTFNANETPFNSVRVVAERSSTSPDGGVPLFFGGFYGHPVFESSVEATAAFLDVDICLVLDRSSSMKLATTDTAPFMSSSDPRKCQVPQADSRWKALETAVNQFTAKMAVTLPDERVGVVTFASDSTTCSGENTSEATVDKSMTSDMSLVDTALSIRSNSVWTGMTNIDSGLDLAHSHLNHFGRPHSTKVIILFTDGSYTGANPVPTAQSIGADNIIIITVTFGAGANQTDMQAVASAGNGDHYHAPDTSTLNQIFDDLVGMITVLTNQPE